MACESIVAGGNISQVRAEGSINNPLVSMDFAVTSSLPIWFAKHSNVCPTGAWLTDGALPTESHIIIWITSTVSVPAVILAKKEQHYSCSGIVVIVHRKFPLARTVLVLVPRDAAVATITCQT